jgi:ElaB/YqjD/DUF883 family membrane-anchored ribosome-binding protein
MYVPLAMATGDNRAGSPERGVGVPFEELFDGVDDLIKRVADTENPEIRRIRAKVHASMATARTAFAGGATLQRRPARYSAEAGWGHDAGPLSADTEQTLGVALLVGVGLGVMMSLQP